MSTSVEVAWKTGDADHGDSGGPLLCNNLIVADTSCGIPQPSGEVAVYYARVDAVRDWIQKTTNSWR